MKKWVIASNITGEEPEIFDDYEAAKHMYYGLVESFEEFGSPLGLSNSEEVHVYLAEIKEHNTFDN